MEKITSKVILQLIGYALLTALLKETIPSVFFQEVDSRHIYSYVMLGFFGLLACSILLSKWLNKPILPSLSVENLPLMGFAFYGFFSFLVAIST